MAKYNTYRKLITYQKPLDIIRKHGFKPIAVCQLMLEDTFVFETEEESVKAHAKLENIPKTKVSAWWYGKEDFLTTVKDYESKNNAVRIYWLNEDGTENKNLAVDEASKMMSIPMSQLPDIAKEYLKQLSSEVGFCGETCITAYAHYFQAIFNYPCNDSLYIIPTSAKKWFKENINK
jgi:hypothetical protein